MSDSSGVNEDNVSLMKAMSLKIERLEADLSSEQKKAEGCIRQARVHKQVAEKLKMDCECLEKKDHELEQVWQERDALNAAAAEAIHRGIMDALLTTLVEEERDALSQESDTLKQERDTLKQEAEVLTWQLARAQETLAEKLKALQEEQKECTVCLERPAHVAVVPCGHRCFCTNAECSARVSALRTCPICRTPMTGTLRIF
jgi:hypothetical protein